MNRFYILFIFLISTFSVFAQNSSRELSGLIVNAANQKALENVNISIEGLPSHGTISDDKGRFSIKVDSLPTRLIISIIGFETKKILIKTQEELFTELLANSTALPEIIVRAARNVDTVYHEPYNVVDYIFKDDYLILLVYKNVFEKYDLVLLDENEQYVAHFSLKEYHAVSLFKSCLDYIYLTTSFGVYNIEFDTKSIRPGRWVEEQLYETVIKPCILSMDSLLFYQRHLYQGQALSYYAFKNTEERNDSITVLPLLEDEGNIRRLLEESGNRLPWSGDFWDENITEDLRTIREQPYFLKGSFSMFFPKIYAPIIQKGTSICLFNHLSSLIQYFDINGNKLKEVPIQYHKMKRWKKYILFDEFTQDAYTAFHTRWGEYICQIDLETGTISEVIPLDLDFIEKVTIRDGTLYFLHRNAYKGSQNRMLQKVRVN
jgi:hypothetical protein